MRRREREARAAATRSWWALLVLGSLFGCRAAPQQAVPSGEPARPAGSAVEPVRSARRDPVDPMVAEYAGGGVRASELGRYLLQVDRPSTLGALSKLVGERIVEQEATQLGVAPPTTYLVDERRQMLSDLAREAAAAYGVGTQPDQFVRLEYRQDLETHLTMRLEEARRRWVVTRVVRFFALTTERALVRILVVEDSDLARSLLEQLRAGQDFEALARRHSVHPSRESGGRLPPVARESLNPVVAARAFELSPGALTPVLAIEAPSGRTQYEIVRLDQRLPALGGTYLELRETIEDSLRAEPLGRDEWTAWMLFLERRYGVRLLALSGRPSRGYAPVRALAHPARAFGS